MMNTEIIKIEKELSKYRKKLKNHKVYDQIKDLDDVKIFMENHIFAVWDFMSLLKSLQRELTCINVPWTPKRNSKIVRFINEIVHGEESDFNELNEPKSHFEMYLDAMNQIEANKYPIEMFIHNLSYNKPISECFENIDVNYKTKEFVEFTFRTINTNKPHLIAAAFTFGREDIIPDMFIEILKECSKKGKNYSKLKYYLERHIELDGDEHGPLSIELIVELCDNDKKKWEEVLDISKESLKHRINLWDAINEQILNKKQKNHINNVSVKA
jgi:hypothetical protein